MTAVLIFISVVFLICFLVFTIIKIICYSVDNEYPQFSDFVIVALLVFFTILFSCLAQYSFKPIKQKFDIIVVNNAQFIYFNDHFMNLNSRFNRSFSGNEVILEKASIFGDFKIVEPEIHPEVHEISGDVSTN